jgi:signal transduction histidine kinase
MISGKPPSLTRRLLGGLIAGLSLALALGGLILSQAFKDAAERAFDARLDAVLVALLASVDINGLPTRPLGDPRFEQPLSGWYWQISGPEGTLARSRSLWDEALSNAPPPADGSALRRRLAGPRGQSLRAVERDIILPDEGKICHLLVAATDTEVLTETSRFDRLLLLSLGGFIVLLLIGASVQVGYGLQPLRRLTADLARLRTGDETRLSGSYPAETAPLAEALNNLLERQERQIERARKLAGDLAHGIKTPLSVLKIELERAQGPDKALCLERIESARALLDRHLARASAGFSVEGALTPAYPVAAALADLMRRLYTDKGLRIEINGKESLTFRGQKDDLEEMLGNLLDNACKWAKSEVRLNIDTQGNRLVVSIEDDGPGLPPETHAAALMRGKRLDESQPGSGLGLSIVADLALLYGGELELETSPLGGLKAVLKLPG